MNKNAKEREIYYHNFVNKYKEAWDNLRPKRRRTEFYILGCIFKGKHHYKVTYLREEWRTIPPKDWHKFEEGQVTPVTSISISLDHHHQKKYLYNLLRNVLKIPVRSSYPYYSSNELIIDLLNEQIWQPRK